MEAVDESQFEPLRRLFVRAGLTLRTAAPIALPLAAGLALRLWFLERLFEASGDSLVYGALAKNLLLHGRYALTGGNGALLPTLIRLPGYPLFLALSFRLFGIENYFASGCIQIALDLATCLLLAGFVRRIAPAPIQSAAALATLWLAVLCPFTASYASAPLTETPSVFMLALAMWAVARFHHRAGWSNALLFTFAVTAAALLRPDGALAAVAFAPAMVIGLNRSSAGEPASRSTSAALSPRQFSKPSQKNDAQPTRLARMALACILLALAPFAAWTWRNWQVFHVFQPLAPRSATDPGEESYPGWDRWVKTWCLDFASTYQIYWTVPDKPLDIAELPARAFDSPAQRAETAALADSYNDAGDLTPPIDAGFARLAQQRIAAHPLRYYLWLPLGRVADMWLRPRVENLPIDIDWWVYAHHNAETEFSWAWAGLNALYLLLAAVGLWLRPRFWWALLAYMLLRSALLLTITAPEARYTLECFPMIFALGGVAVAAGLHNGRRIFAA